MSDSREEDARRVVRADGVAASEAPSVGSSVMAELPTSIPAPVPCHSLNACADAALEAVACASADAGVDSAATRP